ncbi:MAG TPA: SCO family protein [Povalibacter sp.]|nr:SCO family protein [Povalibacter sp.]
MRCRIAVLALLVMPWFAAPAAEQHDWPSQSLYQLDVALTNQDGRTHGLDVHAGHPVLVTMFYGSCPATCPLIMETLRAIEQATPAATRMQLRVLMISIDPERDSVASLSALARTRRLDTSRWTLARTDAANVRKIAAALNVQYRQLPNGDFNHSNVISVLTTQGEIVRQSSVIGRADQDLLAALKSL